VRVVEPAEFAQGNVGAARMMVRAK